MGKHITLEQARKVLSEKELEDLRNKFNEEHDIRMHMATVRRLWQEAVDKAIRIKQATQKGHFREHYVAHPLKDSWEEDGPLAPDVPEEWQWSEVHGNDIELIS